MRVNENRDNVVEQEPLSIDYLSSKYRINSGFTLEIRGSQDWLMKSTNISSSTYPKFNNMAVSSLYSIADNFQAGIDIRQENFFQEFTGYDEINEKTYSIQQQPNFTSAGLALRYTWNGTGTIPVINQFTIGGTNVGIIGRFMLGTCYSPYSNISFVLGLEYSILRYYHLDEYFVSPKIGFNYGVSFKL